MAANERRCPSLFHPGDIPDMTKRRAHVKRAKTLRKRTEWNSGSNAGYYRFGRGDKAWKLACAIFSAYPKG